MSRDILIVDQDRQLASLYGCLLSTLGFRVAIARNCLDCRQRVLSDPHWVLVLDQELPWGESEATLTDLREDGLPVAVIATTWKRERVLAGGSDAPIIACLRKFFSLQKLRNTIDAILSDCQDPTSSRGAAQPVLLGSTVPGCPLPPTVSEGTELYQTLGPQSL